MKSVGNTRRGAKKKQSKASAGQSRSVKHSAAISDAVLAVPPEIMATAYEAPDLTLPQAESEVLPHIVAAEAGGTHRGARSALNSIEAEELLRASFEKAQSAGCFETIKNQRIGDYWDPQSLRDPFLEALTFRQICNMKISHILEKHSFNQRKLLGIIQAVDNCLFANEPTMTVELAQPKDMVLQAPLRTERSVVMEIKWLETAWAPPALTQAIICAFEAQWRLVSAGTGPLARIVTALPTLLNKQELCALWLQSDHEDRLVADILKISVSEVAGISADAAGRVRLLLRHAGAGMLILWETALLGVGLPLDCLVRPYLEVNLDIGFQNVLCRVLLKSLGAVNPSLRGTALPEYWTMHAGALELVLGSVRGRLPMSEASLRAECAALAPFVPFEEIVKSGVLAD